MKNAIKLLAIIAMTAVIGFSFAACDDGGTDTTHTHTYSAAWSSNASQHWRECTANDGAKTDTANHTGDPCTVCAYASQPSAFVAVTSITGVPAAGTTNEELTLTGTVNPSNATNKTITWTIKTPDATNSTLSGNKLTAANAGTVTVTAAITNGLTESTNYTQEFTITITQFEGVTHTVTFTLNGGTINGSTADVKRTVNHGADATAPDNPSKTGYTFDRWDGSFTNVTSDVTVTAQYTINQYKVIFKLNGGNISGSTADVERTVDHETAATAPGNPAKTGYTFASWDLSFTNVISPLTVTAQWTAITYTIAYNNNANDAAGSTANSAHTYDTAKALTANGFTRAGYTFAGWNEKDDGTGASYTNSQSVINLTTTANATVTLYAKWRDNNTNTMYYGVISTGGINYIKSGNMTPFNTLLNREPDGSSQYITETTIDINGKTFTPTDGNGCLVIFVPASLGELKALRVRSYNYINSVSTGLKRMNVTINEIEYYWYYEESHSLPGFEMTLEYYLPLPQHTMYYGVITTGAVDAIKSGSFGQAPFDSGLSNGKIIETTIDTSGKDLWFYGDGVTVIFVPASFGPLTAIRDALGYNVISYLTKTSVTINGTEYYLYEGSGSGNWDDLFEWLLYN